MSIPSFVWGWIRSKTVLVWGAQTAPIPGRKEIEDLGKHKPKPHQLPRHEKKEMVQAYIDGSGKQRVKGGKDLKASQAYPRWSFGEDKYPQRLYSLVSADGIDGTQKRWELSDCFSQDLPVYSYTYIYRYK